MKYNKMKAKSPVKRKETKHEQKITGKKNIQYCIDGRIIVTKIM